MERTHIDPAAEAARPPQPHAPNDRTKPATAPSPALEALCHIGLRLGVTIVIAAALQLISDRSAG